MKLHATYAVVASLALAKITAHAATLFATSDTGVHRFEVNASGAPLLNLTFSHQAIQRPVGTALSPNGELFVVSHGTLNGNNGSMVRFLNPLGTPVFNGVISNGFNSPHGADFRGNELLVVDSWNNRVRRFTFDGAGAAIETNAITEGLTGTHPRYMRISPSGEVFVSQCCSPNEVRRYLISGGVITANGSITGNGVSNPHCMAFSPWGELFVANYDGHSVSRFVFSNGVAVANGVITGNGMSQPTGVDFSPWGELFVASSGAPGISRWTFAPDHSAIANGVIIPPQICGTVMFVNASSGQASSQIYDLKTDWSNNANPNGAWTYREGNNVLPQMMMSTNCGACPGGSGLISTNPQPAWARSSGGTSSDHTFLPFWFKSNGSETGLGDWGQDWEAGDVVMHTTDPANGIGSGAGNVIWTSPIAGVISISGNIWIGRDIGRANHWAISLNDSMLTGGDVSSGDAFSRTNPMSFSAGTAGPSVLNNISVNPGDVIKLEITRTSSSGDVVGLNFTIGAQSDCGSGAGWTAWTNGHYYKLFVATNGVTWSGAKAAAEASGGYLATVTSAEENSFIFSISSNTPSAWYYNVFNCGIGPWLGGYQSSKSAEPGGNWTWLTGESFSYNNWHGGEPSNSGNTEEFLHLYICNGQLMGPFWNDISDFAEVRSYIVERNSAGGSCYDPDGGLVFQPFCTNLTVTLSAASTNCVVSTNYFTNSTVVTSSLIDWLKADGNVIDASGNGNTGNAIDVTYEAGQFGQAFSISELPFAENASARRVDLGPLTQLYSATGFTVSAWVKIPTAANPVSTNNWTYIFTHPARLIHPTITNNVSYGLFISPSVGTPARRATYGIGFDNGTEATVGTSSAFPDNQWVHLAISWSSNSGALRMYRNGILEGTTPNAGLGRTLPTAAQRSPLGPALSGELGVWDFVSDVNGAQARYGGAAVAIDDFRLYTRVLTTNEIQLIYNGEPPAITNIVSTNCTPVEAVTTNLDFCTTASGKLQIFKAAAGNVGLQWSSLSNAWYLLEGSAEVYPSAWTNVWGAGPGNGSNVTVLEPASQRPRRFYRLLSTE